MCKGKEGNVFLRIHQVKRLRLKAERRVAAVATMRRSSEQEVSGVSSGYAGYKDDTRHFYNAAKV